MHASRSARRSLQLAIVTASLLLAATGCAGPRSPLAAAVPSATATAACPHSEYIPDEGRDCLVYDPEKNMAENERYRERIPVSPELQTRLDRYVAPVQAALDALPTPTTPTDVTVALKANGLMYAQTLGGDGTDISWGAGDGSAGCLFGVVAVSGEVTVSTGGIIQDGGCLAMIGH